MKTYVIVICKFCMMPVELKNKDMVCPSCGTTRALHETYFAGYNVQEPIKEDLENGQQSDEVSDDIRPASEM